jgi:hypothetical protein
VAAAAARSLAVAGVEVRVHLGGPVEGCGTVIKFDPSSGTETAQLAWGQKTNDGRPELQR